jgi:type 1 glutamine amidotransferase
VTPTRRALIVRGGWPGHSPVDATELFVPGLCDAGFDIRTSESLDVYESDLTGYDLIVQCWSMGRLTGAQCDGLVGAVRSGVGFAGWHGGLVGTFDDTAAYYRMVGGKFLHHPPGFQDYDVRVTSDHPVVAGIDDFAVHTEQYWMATDAWNDVHATTTVHPGPDAEFDAPVPMPVVWTRKWGSGKVFFSAIGHRVADLTQPEVFTLTLRGLLWASR